MVAIDCRQEARDLRPAAVSVPRLSTPPYIANSTRRGAPPPPAARALARAPSERRPSASTKIGKLPLSIHPRGSSRKSAG